MRYTDGQLRKIDKLISEHVIGNQAIQDTMDYWGRPTSSSFVGYFNNLPHYSTSKEAALGMLEDTGFRYTISKGHDYTCAIYVTCLESNELPRSYFVFNQESLPVAICLGVLKSYRVDVEKELDGV